MKNHIQVVEYRALQCKKTGKWASLHGVHPGADYEVATKGFTWKVYDHNGNMTVGLYRTPAETAKQANTVALNFQKARPNYTVELLPA